MEETFLLSKKKNIKFDYNPVVVWIERISKMPRNLTSSMFIDFKKKKIGIRLAFGKCYFHGQKKFQYHVILTIQS